MSDQQQGNPFEPQPLDTRRSLLALTPEEQVIARECRRESLYYSCLPLSAVLGLGASYLRNIGVIKVTYLGISVAVFTGYMAGKIAYLPTCRRKFAERLPNSSYGKLLSGKITQQEYLNIKQAELQAGNPPGYQQQYSNQQTDFRDDKLSNANALNNDNVENDDVKQNVTYDELRRKHRGEFNVPQPTLPKSRYDIKPKEEVDWSKSRMTDIQKDKGKKNQYGDIIDE